MEFIPLHFADKLRIINPQGTIGVVTLWSKVDYVIERFRQAGVNLDPATSPIAVFGTLYGNGLREMLRNLLYNPQIGILLICGNDRSGSFKELNNFFELGLEPVPGALIRYKIRPVERNRDPQRILKTKRIIDPLVIPEAFKSAPHIHLLGDPQNQKTIEDIEDFFTKFKTLICRFKEDDRLRVILPEVEVEHFPSNPRGHVVVRDSIIEAWKEVLYLLTRFGRRVTLKKGDRLELQHVKVVVEEPR
ncbi:MAG: hypothetical protein M0P73_03395, partial [Syntrophobacterales bacterium]|nr:hypothetical protein [Syntrophobacterales bacterium]